MIILSAQRHPGFLLLETSEGRIKLEPVSPAAVRVVYTQKDSFSTAPSLVVLPQATFEGWRHEETPEEIRLLTDCLTLSVDRKTGAFAYRDARGNLLTLEPPGGGKSLAPVDVIRTVFDPSAPIDAHCEVDGIRGSAAGGRQVIDRQAFHARLDFQWAEGEALFGLGSHEEGMMNLRGQRQYLYQQNMKCVVPVLLSTRGYGVLVDCCSLMTFHDDAFGSCLWCDVVDELDYYFLYGPGFDDIVVQYRALTGPAPMLPRWAFGYVQSKERYHSQEELLAVAAEYRRRGLPLDVIVLDWHSWTGALWGQKTMDPERFPDPDQMMEELHRMNVRLMVSVWPAMAPGGQNHEEMHKNGYLLGNQTTYDAFQPGARAMYWEQARDGLFRHGIDAWWCDCTEPFESDWRGAVKPEPEERMLINTGEAKKYMDPETISAYSLLHSEGIYRGQRATTDAKRVVNLTRSAYAGQHRYSTITWSGDISANWETLKKQIPAGLNFCATGEPYWTLDIGAFFAGGKKQWGRWCQDPGVPAPWFLQGDYDDGCDDLGYRELYTRWFQLGAFLPMFRSHGTDTPREVWRFGEPGTVFYDTMARFLRLRYRLLPYLYSLAGWTTHRSYTMLRMLAFDFPDDSLVHDVADQFMLGPALMVCPVTEPMYFRAGSEELKGVALTRPVYLPAGCGWFDFWTGERYAGGQTVEAAALIDIVPLFVREGSVLPLGPDAQHAGEGLAGPVELRVYPGADGEFLLYEDEGDNYNYETGACAFTRLLWRDSARELTCGRPDGSYLGQPERREYRVVIVSAGHGAGVGETADADKTILHGGSDESSCSL